MAGRIEIGNFKVSWGGEKKSATGTYDLKGTAAWDKILGAGDDFAEERVNERRAHQLATVYTCINVRAQTIASLPINIIREREGTKEIFSDHPAYYPLAHEPNNYMSSANLMMTSMIHADSWGNSIIGINRNDFERPTSFDLIAPGDWNAVVRNGEAFYNIRGVVYAARDVLHFRWWSIDGLTGISPIRQNSITMGKALKADKYSTYTLGKRPPGILSYNGNVTPTQQAQNQKSWQEDLENGRTPVLGGAEWKYQGIMIPPGDAEYIETEGLTDQRIYGIYRIPPVFAQNYLRATWQNAEQSDLIFAKHTIVPIVRVIEQECNMKLFTEREKATHSVKFNMNGLLRGDLKARSEFYTTMRNIGAMDANEVRDKEDMNPYPGGEIKTIQSANIPVDQLRKFWENQSKPKESKPVPSEKNGHKVLNDN